MDDVERANLQAEIDHLNLELQQQKGMLWILGEIMKSAANINSFRELMKILTDMLMGVMGVSSCYLWTYNKNKCILHCRSILLGNVYKEIEVECVPHFLQEIQDSKPFHDHDIQTPLLGDSTQLPGSRLAIPLYDFQHDIRIGMLVVEHEECNFFTESTSLLFQTLAIFIGANSRNSKLFETVSKETELDPLTQIHNRKYLEKVFHGLHQISTPLCLCIFDVDHFKNFNDTYGHAIGDDVLVTIAQTGKKILSPYNGKIIRFGGDEFIILLYHPLEQSLRILEQMRTIIPTLDINSKFSNNDSITITMGVVAYPEHTKNINNLFYIADNALLRGKSKGRNCIEIATEEDITSHHNSNKCKI